MVTRREFLATIGAAAAYRDRRSRLVGVSGSAGPSAAAAASMRFGYAAITWGGDIVKAMDDIAGVGFRAIQLRGEAFAQYGDGRRSCASCSTSTR